MRDYLDILEVNDGAVMLLYLLPFILELIGGSF
mgnify:FL=1